MVGSSPAVGHAAEQTSAAELPCDHHRGVTELFGVATFDLKPLLHTQNALLACVSGKKLQRESLLDESASLYLSVCRPIAQCSTGDNYL